VRALNGVSVEFEAVRLTAIMGLAPLHGRAGSTHEG
jgi:hypothetical protein